jgi:hypothetical protein
MVRLEERMAPSFKNGNVTAECPRCGAVTAFEYREPGGSEFGAVVETTMTHLTTGTYNRTIHHLLRCTVCGRPGVASVYANNSYLQGLLASFWPHAQTRMDLPDGVPAGVFKEFREAEQAMGARCWRASAALLRSTLEKALVINGYDEVNLYRKIEAAGQDGAITSARRQRAQDLVRTLGNDVLHEEWREVSEDEVDDAHHYVGRVIEDLYDDRPTVESMLVEKGRIKANLPRGTG